MGSPGQASPKEEANLRVACKEQTGRPRDPGAPKLRMVVPPCDESDLPPETHLRFLTIDSERTFRTPFFKGE